MTQKRKSPAPPQHRAPRNHTNEIQSTATESDFDFDKRIVDTVDRSIWNALYNGEFRLATKCRRCGRWLTNGRSKRNHMGAHCAAKAVAE